MANDNISNSDVKVLANKIDNIGTRIGKYEKKVDEYHNESVKRHAECEKQTALLEQSQQAICKDIEDNVKKPIAELKEKQEKNDMWTKIIGGLEALILGWLTYLGITK
ncbi:MAG: hypothetical protein ACYTFW_00330 [Planctomycetota bacterium]|jgi:hypothetical protein